MVYAQPSSCPGEWHGQTPMGLWHTNRSSNLGQKTRPYSNQQKKKRELAKLSTVLSRLTTEINCEKKDKYLDLARELKKLWNMKVIIIPIVIVALGTVTKGLIKGLDDLTVGGWVETIQTRVWLRMARILRRVLETWGDLLSLSEKSSANADVNNSRRLNNNPKQKSNSSIWPIDRTISTTTTGQSGPGSNGNGEELHISKLSDWSFYIRCSLISYQFHKMVSSIVI